MSCIKNIDDFSSWEEKLEYARSVLLSQADVGWCAVAKEVVENIPLTESEANSLIESFRLTALLMFQREAELTRREHEKPSREHEKLRAIAHEKLRAIAQPGFVYLLHVKESYYKIGRSTHPDQRRAGVECTAMMLSKEDVFFKVQPTLLKQIETPDMKWAEARLHSRYCVERRKISKLSTEIFELSKAQVEEICAIDKLVPTWFEQSEE